MSENRKRPYRLQFRMNEKEKKIIDKKLELSGMATMESYIRKMLLTGYILKLDLEPINKIMSLLSHCSNNLNQLARKANSYEAINHAELDELKKIHDTLLDVTMLLLDKVSKL